MLVIFHFSQIKAIKFFLIKEHKIDIDLKIISHERTNKRKQNISVFHTKNLHIL